MLKSLFAFSFFFLSVVSVSAQNVSKNLVYSSAVHDIEDDPAWLHTVSPDGRYIVLGCGNYLLSKITHSNICFSRIENLQVYDTAEKKLSQVDLSSVFTFTKKTTFAFTFAGGSSLIIAELPYSNDFDVPENLQMFQFQQKIINVNLSTMGIVAEQTFAPGKVCTQLGYFASQVACAQNSFQDDRKGSFLNELSIVFYDANLKKVFRSFSVSKDKTFVMIPPLTDREAVEDRSVKPAVLLIASENLGSNFHTTGNSFRIDSKTGHTQVLPEIDNGQKRISEIKFIGNYQYQGQTSLYLIKYDPRFIDGEPPVRVDEPSQLLAVGATNAFIANAPTTWSGNFYEILGVAPDANGLPQILTMTRKSFEDESSQLTIKGYSILSGKESDLFSFEYTSKLNQVHYNVGVLWDDHSESFYLLNGYDPDADADIDAEDYRIAEIHQVSLDGSTIQRAIVKKDGVFYLNPRSSHPILLEYSENGASEFKAVYAFSPVKRRALLIDQENVNIYLGAYIAPLFVNDKGLVVISAQKQGYAIYYYEY